MARVEAPAQVLDVFIIRVDLVVAAFELQHGGREAVLELANGAALAVLVQVVNFLGRRRDLVDAPGDPGLTQLLDALWPRDERRTLGAASPRPMRPKTASAKGADPMVLADLP